MALLLRGWRGRLLHVFCGGEVFAYGFVPVLFVCLWLFPLLLGVGPVLAGCCFSIVFLLGLGLGGFEGFVAGWNVCGERSGLVADIVFYGKGAGLVC